MDGFGSHTYQFVNAAGERNWVKFHFKTNQGIDFLPQAEAEEIAGHSPDFHRADLFDSIKHGEFPSWSFEVQIMPYEDAWTYKYNPFDLTKVWSQKDYPRIKVGTLTLNRNPENYFAQIEQSSFEPSNFVPGIETSPDKMLLGRIFSYADAHRYRIGTNYADLPVNAPKNQRNSYSKDGAMRYSWNSPETPVYAPNSYGGPHADEAQYGEPAGWDSTGPQQRVVTVKHEADSDVVQAGILVREVMRDDERERLVANIAGHAANGVTPAVLNRVFEYWTNIDAELGKRVEEATLAKIAESEPTSGQTTVPEGANAQRDA